MTDTSQEFRLSLRSELFASVKEYLAIGLSRPVDDAETRAFLSQHPSLLGSIVEYNAFQPWVVTTRTGERYEVRAINEHHARSLVIYGASGPLQIDSKGKPIGPTKVHPENILTVAKG